MTEGIKIKVIKVYEEPTDQDYYKFVISLSNGQTSTDLEFYSYGDSFKEFGEKLAEFPKSIEDIVTYELGEDEEKVKSKVRHAYYLLLEVFCFDPAGHSAIKIIADNNSDSPDQNRCKFYIKANPASLNMLGQGLKKWNPADTKEFEWTSNL